MTKICFKYTEHARPIYTSDIQFCAFLTEVKEHVCSFVQSVCGHQKGDQQQEQLMNTVRVRDLKEFEISYTTL